METGRIDLTAATVLMLLAALGAYWLSGFVEPETSPESSVLPPHQEADAARAPIAEAPRVTRPSNNAPGAPGWDRVTFGQPQAVSDPLEAVTDSAEAEVRWIGDSLDPEGNDAEELEPVALGEFLDPDASDVGYSDTEEGEVVDLGVSLDPDTPLQETRDPGPPVRVGEPRDSEIH